MTKKLTPFQTGVRRYYGLEILFQDMVKESKLVDAEHLCNVYEGMVEKWRKTLEAKK